MAVIAENYNFLFILNPRTASTATAVALYNHFELHTHWIPATDILDENGNIVLQKKHSTVAALLEYGFVNNAQILNFTIAVTVRNPFDSLLSLYTKKKVCLPKVKER